MVFKYLVFLLLISAGCHCADQNPTVQTPLGKILGHYGTSYNGRKYLAFEGIPYAKPPTGGKRFEEPEPIEPWEGVLNTTVVTSCVQVVPAIPGYFWGSEDCLHVNVYVPRDNINPDENLEVVVNIHGGGFYSGSGNLLSNPQFVTDKEVIYVTFNYRLTFIGFLSTQDDVVPGNNGLKDQVLALKWVKDNIASFGGNPDSITAIGLSAGSGSLHLHYLSELSKGLFHRGLCQSGTGLNPWATIEGSLDKTRQLAAAVDCPTDTSKEMVDCLKEVAVEVLVEKLSTLIGTRYTNALTFGPVIEKGGSKPFISEYPYKLLAKGQVQDLPIVVSNVLNEGAVFTQALTDTDYQAITENWNELAPYIFDYNYTVSEGSWTNVAEAIREHYFGDQEVTFAKLTDAVGERSFNHDAETTVRLQANVTKAPVYYYIFAYPGENNPDKVVIHGSEIKYMWGPTNPEDQITDNDLKMKDLLWDMVVSYAQTGTPSFKDVEWQPMPKTNDKDVYLYVAGFETEDITLKTSEELTERKFWKSLEIAENENLPED